jgi:hypothetical protein
VTAISPRWNSPMQGGTLVSWLWSSDWLRELSVWATMHEANAQCRIPLRPTAPPSTLTPRT